MGQGSAEAVLHGKASISSPSRLMQCDVTQLLCKSNRSYGLNVVGEYASADMSLVCIKFARARVDEVLGSRLYQVAQSGCLIPDSEVFSSVDRFLSKTEISSYAAEERERKRAVRTGEMEG
jgi:hypothetical protein